MIVGPGAIVDQEAPSPTLEGASEYAYVTLLNPLTDDFAIKVAMTRPVDLPFDIRKDGITSTITNTESDVRQVYGMSLKNPDHRGNRHITNSTVIKAGQTINLKGDEAQVAIRQLVNEVLQREGKKMFLADPTQRRVVEDRIVIGRGSIQDLMDNNMRSTQQQANDAINKSNEAKDERAFPGITQEAEKTAGGSDSSSQTDGSAAGSKDSRTKKAN